MASNKQTSPVALNALKNLIKYLSGKENEVHATFVTTQKENWNEMVCLTQILKTYQVPFVTNKQTFLVAFNATQKPYKKISKEKKIKCI